MCWYRDDSLRHAPCVPLRSARVRVAILLCNGFMRFLSPRALRSETGVALGSGSGRYSCSVHSQAKHLITGVSQVAFIRVRCLTRVAGGSLVLHRSHARRRQRPHPGREKEPVGLGPPGRGGFGSCQPSLGPTRSIRVDWGSWTSTSTSCPRGRHIRSGFSKLTLPRERGNGNEEPS